MKDVFRKLVLVVGAMAAFAFLPTRAEAQSPYSPMFWSFEGGVGMAVPMGEIADAAEAGPSFSGAASYFLRPRLALRVDAMRGEVPASTRAELRPDCSPPHSSSECASSLHPRPDPLPSRERGPGSDPAVDSPILCVPSLSFRGSARNLRRGENAQRP